MGESWKCPQLETLADILSGNENGLGNFLKHAASCEHCHLWSSYAFAAEKALAITDRLMHHSCPARSHFNTLLFGTIHTLLSGACEKINREMYRIDPSNLPWLWETSNHINRDCPSYCEWCRTYYDALFDAMVKYQRDYYEAISQLAPIERFTVSMAQEIDAEAIGYDPNKKPN